MFLRSGSKPTQTTVDPFTREHALECIPIRNPQVSEMKNDSGELCLTYQVLVRPWFQNIVQKITGRTNDIIERKLQLDGLGSTVWQMIDGHRSVRDIVGDFQDMHQLNRREAEISVTTFVKELGKRGLIVMKDGEQ